MADVDDSTLERTETADTPAAVDDDSPELASDIEVTVTALRDRQRQLTASLLIPAAAEHLWRVLTDYERLPEFIPNLAESTIVGEQDGATLLKQVGTQRVAGVKFRASVTLKMATCPCERIDFVMVEGDFVRFEGSWCLTPQSENATELTYALTVQAPRYMPISLIERRLKQDIGVNLDAIRCQACLGDG